MIHYLMIKTHCTTGLKYLCKTSTENPKYPFTYKGSGKYWKRHLKTHGNNITTEIVGKFTDKQEFIKKAILLSEEYDVVNSDEWANLVPERGDGGPTMLGRCMTKDQNERKSKALKNFYKNVTEEYMENRAAVNSKSHEKYRYYTPAGIFTNAYKAADANNCSNVTLLNRCVWDVDKKIESKKYWKFGWRGKTWRELGWSSEPLT